MSFSPDKPLRVFCTQCGFPLEIGEKFCASCGNAISEAVQKRISDWKEAHDKRILEEKKEEKPQSPVVPPMKTTQQESKPLPIPNRPLSPKGPEIKQMNTRSPEPIRRIERKDDRPIILPKSPDSLRRPDRPPTLSRPQKIEEPKKQEEPPKKEEKKEEEKKKKEEKKEEEKKEDKKKVNKKDEIERLKQLGIEQQFGDKSKLTIREVRTAPIGEMTLEQVEQKIAKTEIAIDGMEKLLAFYDKDPTAKEKAETQLKYEKELLVSLKKEQTRLKEGGQVKAVEEKDRLKKTHSYIDPSTSKKHNSTLSRLRSRTSTNDEDPIKIKRVGIDDEEEEDEAALWESKTLNELYDLREFIDAQIQDANSTLARGTHESKRKTALFGKQHATSSGKVLFATQLKERLEGSLELVKKAIVEKGGSLDGKREVPVMKRPLPVKKSVRFSCVKRNEDINPLPEPPQLQPNTNVAVAVVNEEKTDRPVRPTRRPYRQLPIVPQKVGPPGVPVIEPEWITKLKAKKKKEEEERIERENKAKQGEEDKKRIEKEKEEAKKEETKKVEEPKKVEETKKVEEPAKEEIKEEPKVELTKKEEEEPKKEDIKKSEEPTKKDEEKKVETQKVEEEPKKEDVKKTEEPTKKEDEKKEESTKPESEETDEIPKDAIIVKSEWQELWTEDGQQYWFNLVTNESTWYDPFSTEAKEAPASTTGGEWEQCKTETGELYWYNTKTMQSQWENPHFFMYYKQNSKGFISKLSFKKRK